MPRKQTSEKELVVSAHSAAVPSRRKPAATTRKRTVAPAELSSDVVSTAVVSAEVAAEPTYQQIAQLAYAIWEARGCQGGSPEADWLDAEQQLRAAD